MLSLVGIAAVLVLLLDSIELVRRAASRQDVNLITIAKMAVLHLPHVIDIILPFAVLFAAAATLWRLSSRQELAVSRASGLSIWQLLLPFLFIAILLGTAKTLVFNPIADFSVSVFEDYEVRYFDRKPNTPVLQETGLWLKDRSDNEDMIIHVERLDPMERKLFGIIVFKFDAADQFISRLDATSGYLEDGTWHFSGTRLLIPGQPEKLAQSVTLKTYLNWQKLEEGFASPSSMPVWRLPSFIRLLEEAGFSAAAHRVQFHVALASPLMMGSMVLIAASLAIRPPRKGGALGFMTMVGVTGLGIYLISQVFFRLGLSGQMPSALAVWAPTGCIAMLGVTWLLYMEDG
jgi:lipopolysaccharide export system permease protein